MMHVQKVNRPRCCDSGHIAPKAWRKAQPLRAAWHRWEVDRLHINPVILQQHIGDHFAFYRVADMNRNDVAAMVNQRQAQPAQPHLKGLCALLVGGAQPRPQPPQGAKTW